MKGVKKSNPKDSKHGYRKRLAHGVRRCIRGCFYVYCENTSLHGFHYITADKSTTVESVLWFMVCISSIVLCVMLMLRLWANYYKDPISTSIDASNLIWNLPFPAVTICNNNRIYRPHADIIAKQLQTNGISADDSERFFSSLLRLIRPDKVSIDNTTASYALDILGMTVEALMNKLMQPCSSLLLRCAWLGQPYDCNKIFKTVKSKEGFCCAFNSHYGSNSTYRSDEQADRNNFTDFNITSDDLPGVDTILDVPGSGRDVGLVVALNIDRDNYKGSLRPSVGASIFVHDAIDFADIGARITSVSPGHVMTITVYGSSIKSSDRLRSLPLKKRSCYFDGELLGETHYSFQSCISECLAEQLQYMCGCLPFYYPDTHLGVRTCYLTDVDCILSRRQTTSEKDIPIIGGCKKCLPQCNDFWYTIDVEDVEMADVGFDSDVTRGLDLRDASLVNIYFGDISYIEYRRENILYWDGLLASFGGIFGLCLGGSVMSVIELVYIMVRELFKFREMTRARRGLSGGLPAASKMFLSAPADKLQLHKSRNYQESVDGRACLARYEPTVQRRKVTNLNDTAKTSDFNKAFRNAAFH